MATTPEPAPGHCRCCGAPLSGPELAGNCPRCLAALLVSSDADPAAVSPPPVLHYLGDYELLTEIARGGMGVVFRARQTTLDRMVAVKLLRNIALTTEEDVRRFRTEAAAAARLKHPNIVAIHEVGQDHGQHFLAMDLIEGPTLAQLTQNGPLAGRRAAELVARIANAVQHAHAQGILHRDLKPSNVILGAGDEPFVTDFGLARTLDTGSSLTQTGQLLGTPAFMSPEQAAGLSESVGPTADVYSLGALLFHLLTARPPFVSGSLPELLRQVARDEALSPRLLNTSVPRDLATICLKALAKRPTDRYGNARALEDDLGRFLRNEPIRARPAGAAERLWRWCRREPKLAAALGLALLLLNLGGAAVTWQWRRAEREAHTAKEELWRAQLMEARSYRLNGGFGQRTKSLEIIARAAAYRPSVELRNEVIAALVLPDVGTNLWWHQEDNPDVPQAFTSDLEFFVQRKANGLVAVCRAFDQQSVAEFDGPAVGARSAQFSPDTLYVAVRFHGGEVRVWDWRVGKLVLAARCCKSGVGDPVFDFSPDGRELWVANSDSEVERYDLSDGKQLPIGAVKIAAIGLRLDRAGRQLLTFKDQTVWAWDVTTAECLGQWTLPGEVWRVAWHPNGREFAVGSHGAGVFVGEVSHTNLDLLEASGPDIAPTSLTFTPDGSLVLVGGWGDLFAAWDFATRRLALRSRQSCFQQLSDNGQHTALLNEKRGYGVRAFLNPVGIRRLRVPARLIARANGVAWHPGGQWLVMTHPGGWSLWDAARGELLGERQSVNYWSVQFLGSGLGFLTGGATGPEFWPLSVTDGKPHVGEPRRLLPENSGANERAALSPDGTRFAAIGQGGGFLGELSGDSPPIRIPDSEKHDTIEFSPDGRWLRIGGHHRVMVEIRSAADGDSVTNLPTGSSTALFLPGRNELLASGQSEVTFWQVGTWQLLRRLPLRVEAFCDGIVGSWPDGSCALANAKDSMLRLWDLNENCEIACLRLPEGSGAWGCVFDPSGRFMATTSSHPFLRLWDFPALRHELRALGLDWPDAQPDGSFVGTGGHRRTE